MSWWLVQNAVMAAVLAGLVAVICRLGHFRPALRHALWLLVLVKLIAPPVFPWIGPPAPVERAAEAPKPSAQPDPAPALPAEPQTAADFTAESLQSQWLSLQGPTTASETVMSQSTPPTEPAAPGAVETTRTSTTRLSALSYLTAAWPSGPAVDFLFRLWLGAIVLMAGLQCVRIVRFRNLVASGRSASRSLRLGVAEMAARLGIRPPATVIVPALSSPMVWGFGHPTLLWPESLLGRLSTECQQAVLVHELAHLRRRDHWVGWLQMLVGCLWWWNPVFQLISRQMRRNAELACDAWVIETLPAARRAYAEALLEVSQLTSRSAAPLPALGMAGGHPDFERRLIMIMRDRVPCRVPMLGLALIGLLALVAVPGWSLSQQAAPEKPKAKEVDKQTGEKLKADFVEVILSDELVQADKPKADADRLDRLEKQLEALLKEVKAMRGGAAKPATKEVTLDAKSGKIMRVDVAQPEARHAVVTPDAKTWQYSVIQQADGEHSVTLTRATYKMPKDKAEALAKFLGEQVKGQVLETKVDGDGIVVTTTPHAQRTIHEFINLVQGGKQNVFFELRGLDVKPETAPAKGH